MVSVQSATSSGLSQLQRQQAQNLAQQLEAKSAALASQASSARKDADAASRRADELGTLADGAKSEATSVKMAISSDQGFDRVGQKISAQVESLAKAVPTQSDGGTTYSSKAIASSVATPPTGQIINEVA